MFAIRGYYEHGHVFFNEEPPVNTKTEVIITFLTEGNIPDAKSKRMPGSLAGKVTIPDDFNEPLDDLKDSTTIPSALR